MGKERKNNEKVKRMSLNASLKTKKARMQRKSLDAKLLFNCFHLKKFGFRFTTEIVLF